MRRTGDSALVTLGEGRELVLSGTREVGEGNGGIYVDDRRYGRVLVSWGAFERLDFSAAGTAGRPTPISRRGARSPERSPPALVNVSLADWSTT